MVASVLAKWPCDAAESDSDATDSDDETETVLTPETCAELGQLLSRSAADDTRMRWGIIQHSITDFLTQFVLGRYGRVAEMNTLDQHRVLMRYKLRLRNLLRESGPTANDTHTWLHRLGKVTSLPQLKHYLQALRLTAQKH